MTSHPELDLSVIIVSWNTQDLLRQCLESIFNQKVLCRYEVWVVDNNSADDTVWMVQHRFPQAHLIVNEDNLGFGKAANMALEQAKGRYQLLLNPDTLTSSGVLDKLVNFMDARSAVGIAGAQLLDENHKVQSSCYAFPTLFLTLVEALLLFRLFPSNPLFGRYRMTHWSYDQEREVDWLAGACLILRRELIDQIGLLDERFFMYSEDTDLCYRAHQAGWGVRYYPSAQMIHMENRSAGQQPDQMKITWTESYVKFFAKHYGKRHAWVARALLGSGYALRLFLWSWVYLLDRERQSLAKRQLFKWWASLRWCVFGN